MALGKLRKGAESVLVAIAVSLFPDVEADWNDPVKRRTAPLKEMPNSSSSY